MDWALRLRDAERRVLSTGHSVQTHRLMSVRTRRRPRESPTCLPVATPGGRGLLRTACAGKRTAETQPRRRVHHSDGPVAFSANAQTPQTANSGHSSMRRYGDLGWQPLDGWCGIEPSSGAVCASCSCCCPGQPATLDGPCAADVRSLLQPPLRDGVPLRNGVPCSADALGCPISSALSAAPV